ncbi:MAG: glutathione S-transferase N-terminal domain-containing protein [Alphaproteobacteria bacterium]|nr:glutathione S-transferase N-terminal domain-containing protein [Alphaproteobacteria bacterium]
MIDLHTFGTPNGKKVSVMLEEVGLPYRAHSVDITKGEQFAPDYLAVNPNGKIPAIGDPDGPDGRPIALFESGAILIYLAEKTGQLLPPAGSRQRWEALQWLMWQMGGVGPMFGQNHHFRRYAPEPIPYAIERYGNETRRLYGVLDRRLAEVAYVAGEDYGIADIAIYPWVARHDWQAIDLAELPNVARWFQAISARPAVQRGMAVPG